MICTYTKKIINKKKMKKVQSGRKWNRIRRQWERYGRRKRFRKRVEWRRLRNVCECVCVIGERSVERNVDVEVFLVCDEWIMLNMWISTLRKGVNHNTSHLLQPFQ